MTKIGGGGRNPYLPSIGRTARSGKSEKSKGKSKAGAAKQADDVGAVESAGALAPVDEIESPIYDEMVSAAQTLDEDDLEEATRAVVVAVIKEHFGKRGIPAKEMEEITNAVSSSITGDDSLRGRLEGVLRRITATKNKRR